MLNDAKLELERINSLVEQNKEDRFNFDPLASPSNLHCGFCTYRPCCSAFYRKKIVFDTQKWPYDIIGKCLEIRKLGNGTWLIHIEDLYTQSDIIIRGLSADSNRHPELLGISLNSWLGIFNVVPSRYPNSYESTKFTTIYQITEEFLGNVKSTSEI